MADGGPSQRLLPDSGAGIDGTWSPDGDAVLFGQLPAPDLAAVKNVLQTYNMQTRRVAEVPGSEGLRSPRWSPDGRYIFGHIGVCPLPTGIVRFQNPKMDRASSIGRGFPELVAGFQVHLFSFWRRVL